MENELVRSFELSPSKNKHEYDSKFRTRRFVSNMNQYFQNVTKARESYKDFNTGKYRIWRHLLSVSILDMKKNWNG